MWYLVQSTVTISLPFNLEGRRRRDKKVTARLVLTVNTPHLKHDEHQTSEHTDVRDEHPHPEVLEPSHPREWYLYARLLGRKWGCDRESGVVGGGKGGREDVICHYSATWLSELSHEWADAVSCNGSCPSRSSNERTTICEPTHHRRLTNSVSVSSFSLSLSLSP